MMVGRVVLAILLNVGLLAVLGPWLRRQWRLPGRVWRLSLGLGLSTHLLIGFYKGLTLTNDAAYMSFWANVLTAQIWREPAAALHTLLGNELHFGAYHLVFFYGMSNTFFLIKLVALLNLASLGAGWLNGLYLSLFSFVGGWQVARALARCFPATPAAAGLLAFVLWPSVLFWTTGVTKEAVLVGSGAWTLALAIRLLYDAHPPRPGWRAGLGLGLLAGLHFKMRYFFAVPLLGVLIGLALLRGLARLVPGLARRRGVALLLLLGVLTAGAWVASEVSVLFHFNKFTSQVVRIYHDHLQASVGRPHLEYNDLRPTLASIGRHVPVAVANALSRPYLGESLEPLYLVAGLENVLLLALMAWAALAAAKGRPGHLPFSLTLALLIHCLILAIFLGISTPNLGSLNRYRSGLLPYLLLLLLQHDYAAAILRRLGFGNPPDVPPR